MFFDRLKFKYFLTVTKILIHRFCSNKFKLYKEATTNAKIRSIPSEKNAHLIKIPALQFTNGILSKYYD